MPEKIIELLKNLLPDSSLPTKDYIARITINFTLVIIVSLLLYTTINNTILADKMGLSKLEKALPVLSHVDLIRDFQTVRQVIKQFSDAYTEVKSSFIIVLVNETGNIVTKNSPIEKTDTLLWTVTTYKGGEDSLYILDEIIRKFNKNILPELQNHSCTSAKVQGTNLENNRAISDMLTTHYVACPIFTKKGVLVGYTLSFLSLTPVPLSNKAKGDTNTILLWTFEDRLLRVTKFVESYFRSFEVQYKIHYN
jgi:hypothetical protein